MLRVFRELNIKQNGGTHRERYVQRFVDEYEFKVSVLGQRRLEKNRSPGFVLEPNCAEIIHYNIAGEKLKAVIEQANINHVHITTPARISIFLSQ